MYLLSLKKYMFWYSISANNGLKHFPQKKDVIEMLIKAGIPH